MKKNKLMIVLCVMIALMATAYAFLSETLSVTSTGNISTTWNVKFTKITYDAKGTTATNAITPKVTDTTAVMSANLLNPGDEMNYEITLSNSGSIDAIIENVTATAEGTPAIVFSIEGIKKGQKLAGGASTVIKVRLYLAPNVPIDLKNASKVLTVSVNAVQDTGQNITEEELELDQPIYVNSGLLIDAILQSNTVYADNVPSKYVTGATGIDFGAISSDINGKGLYYTSTNTENNLRTYYFRGDVKNNYVKFGKDNEGNDLYWRIIRINEDGSTRMIYQGTSATATGDNATIGTSAFNDKEDDNAYVGYMYGATGQTGDNAYALTHANTNDSRIKTYIDNWYSTKTNLSTYLSTHLADSGFCNDRSLSSETDDTFTFYGSVDRLSTNKNPQFACPNAANDLFTTSSSTKGNKALTNPIGLITADEVAYAGGKYGASNSSYYLYTSYTSDRYWTMTPQFFTYEFNEAYMWYGDSDGILNTDVGWVHVDFGVRPVINLKSNVEIVDGNGFVNSPYVIK